MNPHLRKDPEIDRQSDEIDSLKAEIAQQRQTINGMNKKIALKEVENAEQESKIAKLGRSIDDMNAKFLFKDPEIDRQSDEIDSLKAEIAQQRQTINGMNEQIALKEAKIAEQVNQIDGLKKTMHLRDAEIVKQIDDIQNLQEKLSCQNVEAPVLEEEIVFDTADIDNDDPENNDNLNETKRYTCFKCNLYSNNIMAKIRTHQKKGCVASKHLIIKDHQCPVCGEKNDYDGMRLHLNQFCAKNGARIKNAESLHSTKTIEEHMELKKKLIEAHSNAKKNRTEYLPFYPIVE